jgi:hypothetical protein
MTPSIWTIINVQPCPKVPGGRNPIYLPSVPTRQTTLEWSTGDTVSADCPCDLSMVAEILKHSDILSEDSNEHA